MAVVGPLPPRMDRGGVSDIAGETRVDLRGLLEKSLITVLEITELEALALRDALAISEAVVELAVIKFAMIKFAMIIGQTLAVTTV